MEDINFWVVAIAGTTLVGGGLLAAAVLLMRHFFLDKEGRSIFRSR
ncbi:MAG: hypothetical protein WAX89_07505 [Alphaproteobacteria bacterium]